MSEFLRCIKVGKFFGEHEVLADLSFDLAKGECIALLGSSGCGKTTLLNIIAGLLACDSGRVECGGRVLDDPSTGERLPIRKRGFAMVFQDFSLWPHMSVGGNVAFGLKLKGVGRADREKAARKALARVGLDGFADRSPASLSGGQQQRVAIARALVVEPQVLLLDEPLSALDALLRDELRDEIAGLIRSLEITALYVTHDQTEAMTIASRVAVMENGRIVQLDEPTTLYREPRTRSIARFLGVSNLLPLHRAEGECRLGGAGGVLLPEPPPQGTWAAFRSQHVQIAPSDENGCAPGEASVTAKVERCKFQGERFEVECVGEGGVRLSGSADRAYDPGQPVRAKILLPEIRFIEE